MPGRLITEYEGIKTSMHFDEDGKLIIFNEADAQELIDENTVIRNNNMGQGSDMRLAARVPVHMVSELEALWDSMGLDKKKQWKKFLNDPDMKAFRTSESRV